MCKRSRGLAGEGKNILLNKLHSIIVQDTIVPLTRHQFLHTRVSGAANTDADIVEKTETSGDLPPSYSLLDIELPDYEDL